MVEGAALEILREAVRFVHQKPCNHAGFTRFEKLNNLLFFPSVLSKALFHRKKAGKNGGLTYTETYRSGHNENDSKSFCLHGHMGSNPTRSAIEKSSNHAGFWIFLFLRLLRKSPDFGLFFPKLWKEQILALFPAFFCVLLPSAAEIARFGKRHTAHHRLRRGEFRTVIQMGVNVCRGGKIRMPQPVLNLLERKALLQQNCCNRMP